MPVVPFNFAQINGALRAPGRSLGANQFTFSIPGVGSIWPGYAPGAEPEVGHSLFGFDFSIFGHAEKQRAGGGTVMTLIYSPGTIVGTTGSDYIISVPEYPTSNLSGAGGNDLIIGDYSAFEAIRSIESNNTRESAKNLDASLIWTTAGSDLYYGPGSQPYATVYIEGQAGATRWVSFTAAAGASISFDVDFGFGSGFGSNSDLVVELVDAAGAVLLTVDDVGDLDDGSSSLNDPRYVGFVAGYTGTYYLHFREVDGAFEGDEVFLAYIAVSGHANTGTMPIGNDTINGDDGNDEAYGCEANDTVNGGLGADRLWGGTGEDTVIGGAGFDRLWGEEGNDLLQGGADWDVLGGGAGSDTIQGEAGRDVLFGQIQGSVQGAYTSGNDNYDGGTENDLIFAGRASDTAVGGAGDDIILGDTTYVGYAIREAALLYDINDGYRTFPIDDPSNWSIEYSRMIANSTTIPHTTLYVETYPGESRVFGGVNLVAGQTITVDIDASWQASNLVTVDTIVALNFNGAYILTNDDSSPLDPGSVSTRESFLTYVVPTSGTYYIVVYEFGGDERFEGDESFLMHVSVTGHAASAIITGGADNLSGNDGNDDISGGLGDDIIAGGNGNDFLAGGGGVDAIDGGVGDDNVLGDDGDDTITDPSGTNTLSGGNGNDTITGGINTDTIAGGDGNDTINGNAGNDTMGGGTGVDVMVGGAGNDTMFVENVGDTIIELANEGFDVVASSVAWTLNAGAHVELLTTGSIAGTASINLTGNEFGQQFWGNNGVNILSGGDGYDELFGYAGNDDLRGEAGPDALFGGAGNDTLRGGLGIDTYFIDDLGDVVVELSGEGSDVLAVGFDYALSAGVSVELMTTGWIGGPANIALTGNELGNEIWGNDGVNNIHGGAGNVTDSLFGFGGNDILNGGGGLDLLIGGTGQDSFAFTTALDSAAADIIADFSSVDDTILLDDAVFTGLALGALSADAFVTGTAALDANDRIIYDSSNGKLYFDADGNGAGAAIQFATLSGNPALTASDFFIF